MFKLSKTCSLLLAAILLGFLPSISSAQNVLNVVCKGGLIDDSVLHSLYRLSDDIQLGKMTLKLPNECMETFEIELNDKKRVVENPYVAALKMVSGKITISDFADRIKDPDGDLGAYTAVNRVSVDDPMVTYLRIGCGRNRKCVSAVLNSIDGFHPEKSPRFCDFAQHVDVSVIEYFKSSSFLPLPVYCMSRSALGGNRSIPAKDDWFMAFEKLGE
ncbi:hypothetical protein [Advenella mimigardefordensis]|uniref:hypothetical protein n=1 Tax=Advenella mimigardefordensis TaxID=302406 RepID=UPI00046CD65F|nr:hypothetical protein [Advenella mimigardefordensis]